MDTNAINVKMIISFILMEVPAQTLASLQNVNNQIISVYKILLKITKNVQLEDKFALNVGLAFIIILEINYVTVLVMKVIFQIILLY